MCIVKIVTKMPCIKEHNKVQQFDGQNLGKKTILWKSVQVLDNVTVELQIEVQLYKAI